MDDSDVEGEKTNEKKREHAGSRRLLIILGVLIGILVVLIAIAVFALARSKPEAEAEPDFDIEWDDEEEDEPGEDEVILTEEINALEQVDSDVTMDESWTHYLLLGVDGESGGYQGKRSDAMIIMSVNKTAGRIVLSSVPRDTLVYIEGKGLDKLTHAYAYGGAVLTVQTFEENFDIHIENYVTVNFNAMVEIVDLIGGVTVSLTQAEADYMGLFFGEWGLSEGEQQLNGLQLLDYCRIRKIDSDYARNERQFNALVAIYNKVKDMSVSTYTALISECWDDIYTDMTMAQALSLIAELLIIAGNTEIENVKLVDSEHSTTPRYGSSRMSVVLVDNLVDTVTRWREALGIYDYLPSARVKQISEELAQLN